MESSRHLLLLLAGLLAVAPCAVAEPCDYEHWGYLVSVFCTSGPSGDKGVKLACCDVLQSVMNISLTEDPLCLRRMNEDPAFLTTGFSTDDLVDKYKACGGDRGNDGQPLSENCEVLPEKQDGPVQIEAIFTDQDKLSLAPTSPP